MDSYNLDAINTTLRRIDSSLEEMARALDRIDYDLKCIPNWNHLYEHGTWCGGYESMVVGQETRDTVEPTN